MLKKIILAASLVSMASCASIIGKSDYPVSIQSEPSNIPFTIKNEEGKIISDGKTPLTVTLPSSNGYFDSASYVIEYKNADGSVNTKEIEANLDGWYFGNIALGGLIGMLIVDPLTGAMYKLPESVSLPVTDKTMSLKVSTIDTLTQEQKDKLVPLK